MNIQHKLGTLLSGFVFFAGALVVYFGSTLLNTSAKEIGYVMVFGGCVVLLLSLGFYRHRDQF